MRDFWKLLSDRGLFGYLTDIDSSLAGEELRVILAELIFRIQALENQCFVLQSLLVEHEITSAEELQRLQQAAEQYLTEKDINKSREAELLATTAINPIEWLSFAYTGRFNQ